MRNYENWCKQIVRAKITLKTFLWGFENYVIKIEQVVEDFKNDGNQF